MGETFRILAHNSYKVGQSLPDRFSPSHLRPFPLLRPPHSLPSTPGTARRLSTGGRISYLRPIPLTPFGIANENGPFLRRKRRPFGPNHRSARERDPRPTSVSRAQRGGCEEAQRADRRSSQGRTRRKEKQTEESIQGPPPRSERERYVNIRSFLGGRHPTRPFSPLPPLPSARSGSFVTRISNLPGSVFPNSVFSIIRWAKDCTRGPIGGWVDDGWSPPPFFWGGFCFRGRIEGG